MRPFTLRGSSAEARFVVLGLAFLIALQAVAAAALTTLGPLHTHRPGSTILVLDDVRRGPSSGESAADGVARRHGHSHAGAAALRHHHAPGDTSVTLAGGEAALHAGDVDNAGGGAALGALIGLVPTVLAWLPQGARDVQATRRAWVPQIYHPDFPERPPRSA